MISMDKFNIFVFINVNFKLKTRIHYLNKINNDFTIGRDIMVLNRNKDKKIIFFNLSLGV